MDLGRKKALAAVSVAVSGVMLAVGGATSGDAPPALRAIRLLLTLVLGGLVFYGLGWAAQACAVLCLASALIAIFRIAPLLGSSWPSVVAMALPLAAWLYAGFTLLGSRDVQRFLDSERARRRQLRHSRQSAPATAWSHFRSEIRQLGSRSSEGFARFRESALSSNLFGVALVLHATSLAGFWLVARLRQPNEGGPTFDFMPFGETARSAALVVIVLGASLWARKGSLYARAGLLATSSWMAFSSGSAMLEALSFWSEGQPHPALGQPWIWLLFAASLSAAIGLATRRANNQKPASATDLYARGGAGFLIGSLLALLLGRPSLPVCMSTLEDPRAPGVSCESQPFDSCPSHCLPRFL